MNTVSMCIVFIQCSFGALTVCILSKYKQKQHRKFQQTIKKIFSRFTFLGRTCGAVWTFERFIDYELRGFVRETHNDVTKTECEDFCLSESR